MKNRKVHFTESQVNEIMRKLNEDGQAPINIDVTSDIAAASGNASIGMQKAKQRMASQGLAGKDTTFSCDSDVVQESNGNFYTKKQLKEAKLRYLRENSVSCSKKEFTEKLLGK